MVECQLPKLIVAGSIPVPRLKLPLFKMISRCSILLFISFAAGCASVEAPSIKPSVPASAGIYHKVKKGETIFRIAKMYGVSVDEIVSANKIPNAAQIEKNQLVFIPRANSVVEIPPVTEATKTGEFEWPVKGRVVSFFGEQKDGWVNNGIDIQADIGEKVSAAREGKIVFADHLNGYGQTVIIDHTDGLMSVYAQNAVLLAKVDEMVVKGAPIAQVGKSKKAPSLHFEIRKNSVATNPLYYLP